MTIFIILMTRISKTYYKLHNVSILHTMIFGGHVSIAGGLHNALIKGREEGFDVLQIFVTSPRTFRTTRYTDEEIKVFRSQYAEFNFKRLFFHAIYLINFGSHNQRLRELSRESVVHYLQMGDKLGSIGTIIHLGTDTNRENIISDIKTVLLHTPSSQYFIVESMASQKRLGSNIDELIYINKEVNSDRIGFCIDTQHLFASGTDVRDFSILKQWLDEFDSKIGNEGFQNILKQPLLQNKSFILETPGFDKKGPDKKNLRRLKCLL